MSRADFGSRWHERRAYDEAHAKQARNAKNYTQLAEEMKNLKCEIKKLKEENLRLLVLLEKCWHDFTEIEHVSGIAPNKELYNDIWKEMKK